MTLARGRQRGRSGQPWIVLPARWVYVLAGWCVAVGLALPWIARWQGVLRGKSGARALRPALIELPGGTFVMGSSDSESNPYSDERPRHQVTVLPFQICETEVTQGQWEAIVGTRPSDCFYGCGDDLPVQNVSWYDVIAYLNELTRRENAMRGEEAKLTPCYEVQGETVTWKEGCTGYRLPTEAEWEYAARAGTQTAYSFGDDAGKLEDYAWFTENAKHQVQEVGTKKENPWGLHDVHGNVWEWVWDWHGRYRKEAETDPRRPRNGIDVLFAGPEPDRVLRGGAFGSADLFLRSSFRLQLEPQDRDKSTGLRCARGVSPSRPDEKKEDLERNESQPERGGAS